MKKIITLFAISAALMMTTLSHAQAPQGMNYQAVARNASGAILANQFISLRFTITDGNGGTTLYQETDTATTNQFGLFTVNVGNGTPVTGTFSSIPWATTGAWMQVELDPAGGTSFVNMGTSELLSVPYALSSGSSSQWNSNGNDIYNANTGNVGIGTTTPAYLLDIRGASTSANFSGGLNLSGVDNPNGDGFIKFQNPVGDWDVEGGTDFTIGRSGVGFDLSIDQTGNVGVGTTTPAAKLDVNGNIRITDGTQGAGKVLTSDGAGNGSWQDAVEHVGFGAYITGPQVLPDQAFTTVVFSDEEYDDGNNYDTLTSTFTAPSNGLYHFDVSIAEDGGPAGTTSYIHVFVNGNKSLTTVNNIGSSSDVAGYTLSGNLKLNQGDTVTLLAFSFGTNQIVYPGPRQSYFSGYKIY